jgi:hypothetical protein
MITVEMLLNDLQWEGEYLTLLGTGEGMITVEMLLNIYSGKVSN